MSKPTPDRDSALPDLSDLSFEEALGRLEEIVEGLEGGQLALEDALARFEEGMALRAECLKRLQAAETTIEQVLADSEETEAGEAEAADEEDPFP